MGDIANLQSCTALKHEPETLKSLNFTIFLQLEIDDLVYLLQKLFANKYLLLGYRYLMERMSVTVKLIYFLKLIST